MRLLLDTHVFLWMTGQPDKLSKIASEHILDERNSLFLSLVSVWEIQIKLQFGKLRLTEALSKLVERQCEANEVQILPIALQHVYRLQGLPNYHRDPFDRLLIAQAQFEKMPIVSVDALFDRYPVQKIWD